jgi:hypothetical protein
MSVGRGRGTRPRAGWHLLALLSLAALAPRAQADEPRRLAEWVTPETILYVELPDPARLIERLRSPALRELYNAVPALRKKDAQQKLRELNDGIAFVAKSLDTVSDRLLTDLTSGGAALAVESPKRIALLVRAGDAATLRRAHETILDLARQDARNKKRPDPVQTEVVEGTTIYQFSPEEAHAIVEDALIASNDLGMLKSILERAHGKNADSPCLASDPTWKARRDRLADGTTAWAFANLDQLRKLDPKAFRGKPEDEPGGRMLLGPWFEALQKSPWADLSASWTDARLAGELTLAAPADGFSEALQRFRPPAGQGAATPIEPPGTIASVSLWRDWSAIWEVRDQILPPEALQGLAQLDTFAGQFFGRDFGSGVLGALGTNWRLVVAHQDYDAMSPAPATKLPGGALILGIRPEDEEFAVRLQSAFQTFVGLANLGAAQQKAPPLMLGSEEVEGITLAKATYLPSKDAKPDAEGGMRYNVSPAAAQVDDAFVLSTSVDLARALIRTLKPPASDAAAGAATLRAVVHGAELARLVDLNRDALAMRNMLEKGSDREAAEGEINLLARVLRYAGTGRLEIIDDADAVRVRVGFDLGRTD